MDFSDGMEEQFCTCFLWEYEASEQHPVGMVARACYRLREWSTSNLSATAAKGVAWEVKPVLDDLVAYAAR